MQNTPDIETIKKLYAALNSNEIAGIRELFDAQIERIEPAGFPSAGTYRGRTDVLAHFTQGRGTWAEGTCEPIEFFEGESMIAAHLKVHVRLKDKEEWTDGNVTDVFIFRAGKIVQMISFADKAQALAFAGIKA